MAKQNLYSGIDLIKYPAMTDKTSKLLTVNKYTFIVDPKISKTNIKKAIEFLFDVKVAKVNTCHLPKKQATAGKYIGMRPHYKKAIIKLKEGYRINYFLEN
jgi:large subunit ribosomal protein L23